MDNFDLKKYLAEGRLFEEKKGGFAFWYRSGVRGKKNALQARELLTQKGIDADYSKGPYYIDFSKSDVEESVVAQLLQDANLTNYVILRDDDNLDEGRLLKENKNYDAAWIASHSDYYDIYIGTKKSFYEDQEEGEDASFGGEAEDYLIDLDPGKFQMIYWDDDGPNNMSFDDKLEFVKESIYNYWGESNFIEKFDGLEDELDALYDEDNPDVYWNAFEKHMVDNLDKYYEIMKDMINNSYPDGDSSSGVVLLVDGKEVAGADNGRLVNFY